MEDTQVGYEETQIATAEIQENRRLDLQTQTAEPLRTPTPNIHQGATPGHWNVSNLAQAKQELPQIIQRYLSGESMQTLAQEYGIHRQRIYEWMLSGMGDQQYYDAVTKVLVRRVSEADQALENPAIEPDTARAHARARFARMDLERRRAALYGPKQEVTHRLPDGPLININLGSVANDVSCGATVDVLPTDCTAKDE